MTIFNRTGTGPQWDKLMDLAKRDGAPARYYHDIAGWMMIEGVNHLSFDEVTPLQREILEAMGFSNIGEDNSDIAIPFRSAK